MKERFKYDIFISYKQEELDKAVALKLQKKIKHYRIPKEIKRKIGKKKIKKIFRDEEISVSSQLDRQMEERIKQTEYLLLICSKQTKQSDRILKELEVFLKYRDIDHILPIVIDGEPEEVLPEIFLKKSKSLVIDFRDKSKQKILKKIDKEFSCILAPLLHCASDKLKRKHKMYQIYWILGIGLGISIIFTIHVFIQLQKSKKEYQKKQAKYLCNVSENLLESGDRMGALRTAIGILPENPKDNNPVALEQLNALNNALYSYKDNSDNKEVYFRADRMKKLKGCISNEIKFSKEGSYCVAVDNKGHVYFLDGKTGKTLWEDMKISANKEAIYVATPLNEEKAVLVTKTKVMIVDIKDKKVILKKTYKSENVMTNVLISKDKAVLWNREEVITIGLKKDNQVQENIAQLSNIEQVIMDKSQNQLFIAVSGELVFDKGGMLSYSEKNKEGKAGIYQYVFKKKRLIKISKRATEKICLINKNQIAAIQYTKYINHNIYDSEITYCLSVYDVNSGKETKVWQKKRFKASEENEQMGCKFFNIKVKGQANKKILIFYFKKNIYSVDIDKYKLVAQKTFESDITGIDQFNNSGLLVGSAEGSIYLYKNYDKNWKMDYYVNWANKLRRVGGIKNDFSEGRFSYNVKRKTAIQYSVTSKEIVFLRNIRDTKVRIINNYKRAGNVLYFKVKNGEIYRYICNYYEDKEEINIYKIGTSKPIYTIVLQKDEYIDNEIIGLRNKRVTLCYTLEKKNNNLQFYMVDLEKKRKIKNYKLDLDKIYHIQSLVYSDDLNYMWIAALNGQMWTIKPEKHKLKIIEEENWERRDEIQVIKKTKNERYLIFLFENQDNMNTYYLKIWDRKYNNWVIVNGKKRINNIESEEGFLVGKKHNIIAISKTNGKIKIIDIDKGRIQKSIDVDKEKETKQTFRSNAYIDMQFFQNDKYILTLSSNENELQMIDIHSGKLVSEINTDINLSKIVVDDNLQYFATIGTLDGRSKKEFSKDILTVYMMDNDDKRIVKYADIPYGMISFEGKEIIGGKYVTYYTKIYDFLQLRKEAEQLLRGEKLTKAEKIEYFLE